MKKHRYNPEIHHRRSIRLKGHDYAGGGMYFVTICAHRDAGSIFADESVKEMVGRVWEDLPAVGAGLVSAALDRGTHEGYPYVVMPDHFHGIVRIMGAREGRPHGGGGALGDVVGAFKSLVVHEYIAGVKAGRLTPFPGKIWHRNYYERIIWNAEELDNVRNYIRTNPWKSIVHFGNGMWGIGNPSLWNYRKTGMLCSRNCPAEALAAAVKRATSAQEQECVISGFHSAPEKAVLAALLQSKAKIICCPAWGIDTMRIPADWLAALERNRMQILEMKSRNADLAASRERNAFVMQSADNLWIPHASPNGMLAHLIEEQSVKDKTHTN